MFSTHFLFPALMFGLANLVMWVIYVGEFPFFERYRISPEVRDITITLSFKKKNINAIDLIKHTFFFHIKISFLSSPLKCFNKYPFFFNTLIHFLKKFPLKFKYPFQFS